MKDRRRNIAPAQGFDKVVLDNGTAEGLVVSDISRFNENSEQRYRQDVTVVVTNNYPAGHIVGKLVDGTYVGGAVKFESVIRGAMVTVLEPFDKPVVISVGIVGAPTKFLNAFDATKARGTVEYTEDCTHFVDSKDDIIVTVTGTDPTGIAGRIAVVLDTTKFGASTLMPSN